MKRASLGILLAFACKMSLGAPSLCTQKETVYFTCKANNGKIISLCGNVFTTDESDRRVASDDPWLQYRYGRLPSIELVYPHSKKNSMERFTSGRVRANGGQVGLDSIAFVSGGIGYSVDYVMPESGEIWQGVNVGDPKAFGLDRGNKPLKRYPKASITCSKGHVNSNFYELIDYLEEN